MRTLIYILILTACSTCTSLGYHIQLKTYNQALKLKQQGNDQLADLKFKELCQMRHRPSCLFLGKQVNWRAGLAIMQGASGQGMAQFVAVYDKHKSFKAYVFDPKTRALLYPMKQNLIERDYSDWALTYLEFQNLKEQINYQLVLVDDQGRLLDFRDFRVFDNSKSSTRIAIASCMRDDYRRTEEIWEDLERQKPELLLMIGDNSYVDLSVRDKLFNVSEETIWQRHMETRRKLQVFRWKNLVPVYATWDDHDYGKNDGDRTFPRREESEKIFQGFFPSGLDVKWVNPGPGVSYSMTLRNQNFIFLDNRSFRTAKNKQGTGYHFGKKQMQWLGERISTKNLNWLISGDQFFGAYHPYDSFEGQHPKQFKKFKQILKARKASYVLISGDRHLSETMDIPATELGRKSYEITSSPIHSSVYPGASYQYKNPRNRQKIDGKWNYILVDVSKDKGKHLLKLVSRGQNGEVYFKDELILH